MVACSRPGVLATAASLLLLLLAVPAEASPGDNSPVYQECTSLCRRQLDCPLSFAGRGWAGGGCFWCKYECMWKTVDAFNSSGYALPQFHGKWPFYSTVWAQEPASVVFSLLNLAAVNAMRVRVGRLGEGNEERRAYSMMRRVWMGYGVVGMVTWLCSTWFHAADYFWSERADYFSAFAFVLYANYAAVLFTFPAARGGWRGTSLSAVFLLFYLRHIYGLSMHFDYGWNMTVCIACSVGTLVTYLCYLYRRWRQFGSIGALRQSDRLLLAILAWTVISVSLELHDFVPLLFTFDAHSLFHAATVPLPLITAKFIELHARESGFEYSKIV